MLGATSLKLIIHYNPCLWRRFYSISMNLSRVFSKKDRLIFLPCLCNFWGVGLKFDKQILNHVAFFCNTFFEIFLTRFQEKCKTFFHISLHEFLLSVKKKITLILLDFSNHFDNIDIKDYRERLKKYWSGVLDTIARDTLTH